MKLLFVRDRETSSGAEERSKGSCGFSTKCQQGKYMMYYFRKFRYLSTSSGPKNSWRTCCFLLYMLIAYELVMQLCFFLAKLHELILIMYIAT